MSKEEIIELIDELTARLDGPAEAVFGYAVRSALTGAIIQLAAGLAVFGFAAWFIPKALREIKEAGSYSGDGWLFANVGVVALCIAAFIQGLFALHTLLNPEFAALRSLVPGL